MRDLNEINHLRVNDPSIVKLFGGYEGGRTCGAFSLASMIDGGSLFVIASTQFGWDHVSVSRCDRVPVWGEMDQVHRVFFAPLEEAMQLHVPLSDVVNLHPYCLHLWRPNDGRNIPRPPAELVGPKRVTTRAMVAGGGR